MMVSTDAALQDVCSAVEMPCEETPCKETSPDSKCPICLDRFSNVSYTDRCFHRFCFCCILEWGKNKAECPLCKQPFGAVYHSVRSEDDFRLYELPPLKNGSFGIVEGQRFRYRTTLTQQHRREGRTRGDSRQQEVMHFRRWLYRHNVWVRGVRDGGRSRDTSAEFFRKNPACLHRLVPWLNRELAVLCGSHDSATNVVLHTILSLITRHDMQDEAFLQTLSPFLSTRTEHFLHEFLSFAKSPFNMEAYDRHAVYDCPAPLRLSAGLEDDAVVSSAPSPWDDETPGPSYSSVMRNVFSVTISDSDVDSASEETATVRASANINASNARVDEDDSSSNEDCVIIGFIKPATQRTPELIQVSSDSEASVQEEPEPSTSNQSYQKDLTNLRCRNIDSMLFHSATKHNSMSSCRNHGGSRERNRGGSRERNRGGSRERNLGWSRERNQGSHSYKKRSKATNHSSLSHTSQHRHSRDTDTHYRQNTTQRSHARSPSKTHSHSRSRSNLFPQSSTRVRSRSRTRARSSSRTRARSRSRTHARSPSKTHSHSRSRSNLFPQSSTCARSRSRTRARSRSRTRARSRSRTRARSRSKTRARSRSRTHACSYSGSWRTQVSLQDRECSESLSFSPSTTLLKKSNCGAHHGERKHKTLHGEKKRKGNEKLNHHPKKRRRRSSSMEVIAEQRKRHKKSKKHKTSRRNRSKQTGRSSEASSPTDMLTEETMTPRGVTSPNTQAKSSLHGKPTACSTKHTPPTLHASEELGASNTDISREKHL